MSVRQAEQDPRLVPREAERPTLLSVVIPCFDEEENLHYLHERVSSVMQANGLVYESTRTNDGSRDGTLSIMYALQRENPHLVVVDLSRNFGKEIATTAGIDHASGDALVILDADLQDPPELIPELLAGWRDGYDVVYAQRRERAGESWLKKKTAEMFYRLMARLGPVQLPRNTGDFRLMSRQAIDAVRALREHHRFMKGLFAWVGFPSKAIPYDRDARHAGSSKWNYWKLWNLSLEGITSFTVAPLKAATYLGLAISFAAFLAALWYVVKTIVIGDPVPGFPTLITAILLMGGVQLIFLGLIGEYLGRIFNETKQRPLYFVKSVARETQDRSTGEDDVRSEAFVERSRPKPQRAERDAVE